MYPFFIWPLGIAFINAKIFSFLIKTTSTQNYYESCIIQHTTQAYSFTFQGVTKTKLDIVNVNCVIFSRMLSLPGSHNQLAWESVDYNLVSVWKLTLSSHFITSTSGSDSELCWGQKFELFQNYHCSHSRFYSYGREAILFRVEHKEIQILELHKLFREAACSRLFIS